MCIFLVITDFKVFFGKPKSRRSWKIKKPILQGSNLSPRTYWNMRRLSNTFRSIKQSLPKTSPLRLSAQPSSSKSSSISRKSKAKERSWCVYLILSTNRPIKTYVGVTTSFSRRYVHGFSFSPFLLELFETFSFTGLYGSFFFFCKWIPKCSFGSDILKEI